MTGKFHKKFNLMNYISLMIYHKKFLLVFISVSVLISIIYSFIAPEKYIANAKLQPPEESASFSQISGLVQSLGGFPTLQGSPVSKTGLIIEYLGSRDLGRYVVDSLDLTNNPAFEGIPDIVLESVIPVLISKSVQRTGIIYLSFETSTGFFPNNETRKNAAELSASILNTAIRGLDIISRNKSTSKAKQKRIFIEKMLEIKRNELDSVDKAIEKYQLENKVGALDKQAQSTLSTAVSVGAELAKAEIELNSKLMEYEPESSVIEALSNRVNNLRRQFTQMQSGGISGADRISLPVEKLPQIAREYANLLRDQKILEQVKIFLETQHYQEAIQEQSDIPTIEPLELAIVPFEKSGPSKKFIIILGFFLSLVFSLAIITVKAYFKGNFFLHNTEDTTSESILNDRV